MDVGALFFSLFQSSTGLAHSCPLCGIKDLRFHSEGLQCEEENTNNYYLGREEKLKLLQTQKQDSVVEVFPPPPPAFTRMKGKHLNLSWIRTYLLMAITLFCF